MTITTTVERNNIFDGRTSPLAGLVRIEVFIAIIHKLAFFLSQKCALVTARQKL